MRFTVAPSSRMHTLTHIHTQHTLSPLYIPSLDFSSMHPRPRCISAPLRRPAHAHALSFYRSSLLFLFFVFFFRMTSLPRAAPGVTLAPNVTLAAVIRRRSMRDGKKVTRVTSCHRPNQTSTYRTVDAREKAARVRFIVFFPFFLLREESKTSVEIALCGGDTVDLI